jgi:hypothetical protein
MIKVIWRRDIIVKRLPGYGRGVPRYEWPAVETSRFQDGCLIFDDLFHPIK